MSVRVARLWLLRVETTFESWSSHLSVPRVVLTFSEKAGVAGTQQKRRNNWWKRCTRGWPMPLERNVRRHMTTLATSTALQTFSLSVRCSCSVQSWMMAARRRWIEGTRFHIFRACDIVTVVTPQVSAPHSSSVLDLSGRRLFFCRAVSAGQERPRGPFQVPL